MIWPPATMQLDSFIHELQRAWRVAWTAAPSTPALRAAGARFIALYTEELALVSSDWRMN